VNPNSALFKHKQYLKELEEKKIKEMQDQIKAHFDKEVKLQEFKEKAEKRHAKILQKNRDQDEMEFDKPSPEKQSKLTEENLSQIEKEN
jgi:hypothetical protein